jgi:hypothetical protein
MSVRVYILLDIVDRSCEYAVQMLRSRPEVILVDQLEGYPNIIAMVEAADKQSLAEAVMPVLDCIDDITEGLRLLVTQDGEISPDLLTSSVPAPHKRGGRKKLTLGERRPIQKGDSTYA